MLARFVLPVLLGLLIPLQSAARISPPFSASRETVLIGPNQKVEIDAGKRAALFPKGGGGFTDGTVRLRVAASRKMDVALVVRARLGANGAVTQGYRALIRKGKLHLERIVGGRGRRIAAPGSLKIRKRTKSLEILATVVDGHFIVRVYDGRTGKRMRAASASGLSPRSGRIGVTIGKRNPSKAAPTLLAVRKACRKTPPAKRGRGDPLFVTVAAEQVPRMEALKAKRMERLRKPARTVFRISSVELERFYCDGGAASAVTVLTPFKYTDRAYMTWRRRKIARTERALRIDHSVKNPRMVRDMLREWHRRYPDRTRMERLGRSADGRAIWALAVSRPDGWESKPTIFVNGAHHGNEPASVDMVLDAIKRVLEEPDKRSERWLDSFVIWFVPVVNPDGLHNFLEVFAGMGRKNGREQDGLPGKTWIDGVDLNRNYPFRWGSLGEKGSKSSKASSYYRGPKPASEPEVRAVMKLANRERFVAALTYHTGTVAVLAPYTIDKVENPTNNETWGVAEQLIEGLPDHPQKREWKVKRKLYSVDGTDQDWHRAEHGTLALLVEGTRRSPRTPAKRRELNAAVRPLFERLLDRVLDGPSVSGRVLDAAGKPVFAEVAIPQVGLQGGERWMTRERDGRFDRVLHAPGAYDVQVKIGGKIVATRAVEVGVGRVVVTIRLTARPPSNTGTDGERGETGN